MKYFILFFCLFTYAQKGHIHSVAFYNVENLFDFYDHPTNFDEEFTPEGSRLWTEGILTQKINQLANVISSIGIHETGRSPVLVGLAEVENKEVLKLLVQSDKLQSSQYGFIHFDSPDFRGIDVALLYKKKDFIVTGKKRYPLLLIDKDSGYRRKTRDILVVCGYLNQHHISILVNHWPSRRGGRVKSESYRILAARLHNKITDSILRKHPESKLISMGDFNDNPRDKSLQKIKKNTTSNLFNPMRDLAKRGAGSLAYNDKWFLFDQLLFSSNWISTKDLFFIKARVFNPIFLVTPEGKYKGHHYRMNVTGMELKGFSDHFPVYALIGETVLFE